MILLFSPFSTINFSKELPLAQGIKFEWISVSLLVSAHHRHTSTVFSYGRYFFFVNCLWKLFCFFLFFLGGGVDNRRKKRTVINLLLTLFFEWILQQWLLKFCIWTNILLAFERYFYFKKSFLLLLSMLHIVITRTKDKGELKHDRM